MVYLLILLVLAGIVAFVAGLGIGVYELFLDPGNPVDEYRHKLERDNAEIERLDGIIADHDREVKEARKRSGLKRRQEAARTKLQAYYQKQSEIVDNSVVIVREPMVH